MVTRRYFIHASAVAVAGFGMAPSWLARAAAGESNRKIVISIFQRGAADGLNIVAPFFEKRYYDLRPEDPIPFLIWTGSSDCTRPCRHYLGSEVSVRPISVD